MGRNAFHDFNGGRRRLASFRQSVEALESRVLLSGITFDDVTAGAGILKNRGFAFSIAWVDYNTDGLADLWIGRHGPNQPSNLGHPMPSPLLYKNLGDGTFVDVFDSVFPVLPPTDNHGSAWADVDNDGDPDFLQTVGGFKGLSLGGANERLYLNDDGVLVDATRTAGLGMLLARGREAEWIDANRDGLLDVFLSNGIRFDGLSPSKLLLQTGGGWDGAHPVFTDTDSASGLAFAEVQDLNGDRLPDLAWLSPSENTIQFLLATGTGAGVVDGGSLLSGVTLPGNVKDFAFADFNGDLYTDIVISLQDSRDAMLLFDPVAKVFVDVSATAGMQVTHGSQVVATDFDNDGDVDIYVGCESVNADLPDVIYENQGNGRFVALRGDKHTGVSQIDMNFGRKVIAADFDNDGFVDLFQNGTGLITAPNRLLRNTGRTTGNTNHWLELDLSGVRSNRDAIGARVEVTAGGVTQVRYQTSGKHHYAQNDARLHFGLGRNTLIEKLTVYWPSGEVTTRRNVAADQIVRVSEAAANAASLARPILVGSGMGDFRGTLQPEAAQQYFRFDVMAYSTLHVDLTGFGLAVEVWNGTGSSMLKSGKSSDGFVSIEQPLTRGRYLLRVRLQPGAALSGFTMSPQLIPLPDHRGPVVEDIAWDDSLSAQRYAVVAIISDAIYGGSALAAAEFFIDRAGTPGSGLAMVAADGSWGGPGELAHGFVPVAIWDALSFGAHTVFVRAKDAAGNWGPFAHLGITKRNSHAPSLGLMTTGITFLSGVPTKLLFPDAQLRDNDSPVSAGATVTLLLDAAIAGYNWSFTFDNRLRQTGAKILFDGVLVAQEWDNRFAMRLRFNEQGTPAVMREVLRRVKFELTGNPPPATLHRTVKVIVSDGSGGRTGAMMTVDVRVPEIKLDSGKLTYVQNAPLKQISPNAQIRNPDPSGFSGGSLTVSFSSGANSQLVPASSSWRVAADLLFFDPDKDRFGLFGAL